MDRAELIEAITQVGEERGEPGFGPSDRIWNRWRPEGYPGAIAAYHIVTKTKSEGRKVTKAEWDSMLESIGLLPRSKMQKHPPLEEIEKALRELGEKTYGEGFGPVITVWRSDRPAGMPIPAVVCRLYGIPIEPRKSNVQSVQWAAMLNKIGLRYPRAIKSGAESAERKKMARLPRVAEAAEKLNTPPALSVVSVRSGYRYNTRQGQWVTCVAMMVR